MQTLYTSGVLTLGYIDVAIISSGIKNIQFCYMYTNQPKAMEEDEEEKL